MGFLDTLTAPPFDDFDLAPDDAFLDAAFIEDEQLLGVHGLVTKVRDGGRVPFASIDPSLAFLPGNEKRGAPVMAPRALMIHWDASRPTFVRPWPAKSVLRDGRPAGRGVEAVPGPLANLGLPLRGRMTVVATGRANHAGLGDPAVDAAIAAHNLTRGRSGRSTVGSGGTLIGLEVASRGDPKRPFTPDQIDQIEDLVARLRRYYGPNFVVLDHARRSSDRKVDVIAYRKLIPSLRYLA